MAHSHLDLAASRDAAGRPDEAWEALAQGVRAGEAACARVMGLRLLIGDRVAPQVREGLRLLGEACDAGLPESAARAAAVLALGLQQPPDRPLALRWLARAAAGGWQPAREQLLALGGAVDAAAWTQAPPATTLNDAPRVASIAGFASPAVCKVLIDLARPRLHAARVYDTTTRSHVVVADRSNSEANFDLSSVELVHVLVQARMAAACGVPERSLEAPNILYYDPGQQAREHFDFFDPDSPGASASIASQGQRVMTFLLYLNDDYDGGETVFPELGISHRGRRGDALLFANTCADGRPDRRSRHAGRPPTRGGKWVVSQFIRGRATR